MYLHNACRPSFSALRDYQRSVLFAKKETSPREIFSSSANWRERSLDRTETFASRASQQPQPVASFIIQRRAGESRKRQEVTSKKGKKKLPVQGLQSKKSIARNVDADQRRRISSERLDAVHSVCGMMTTGRRISRLPFVHQPICFLVAT
jgi:altronate dehydratase